MTAARALSDRERTPAMLLEVLKTGSSRAQEAALVALRGHGPDVRAPVIAWTRARLDRAAELRGARLALAAGTDGTAGAAGTGGTAGTARTGGTAGTAGTAGAGAPAGPRASPARAAAGGTAGVAGASGPGGSPGAAGANGTNGAGPIPDPTLDFLMAVLARRESRTVGLALRALVVLGVPEADGVIRRCLHSDDAEIRAQAIEALDSIGDRELPGGARAPAGGRADRDADRDATLARLSDDEDPWISGLARRVRAGEEAMPDTTRTLGDLETMLFLRRVPLFAGLEPEDLQRVAMTSVEHVYPAGEAVVREGDVGDELIVIVEGSVRVVRYRPNGAERLVRRYEAGDHIGELAVLREAPRAATVIAEDAGMRGLVIGGAGLKSILRERPEAAMAMLAELADRITRL